MLAFYKQDNNTPFHLKYSIATCMYTPPSCVHCNYMYMIAGQFTLNFTGAWLRASMVNTSSGSENRPIQSSAFGFCTPLTYTTAHVRVAFNCTGITPTLIGSNKKWTQQAVHNKLNNYILLPERTVILLWRIRASGFSYMWLPAATNKHTTRKVTASSISRIIGA